MIDMFSQKPNPIWTGQPRARSSNRHDSIRTHAPVRISVDYKGDKGITKEQLKKLSAEATQAGAKGRFLMVTHVNRSQVR